MSDAAAPVFDRALPDDFHREADELVQQFARCAAALEAAPSDFAALEQWFRAAHTFKGLCGIVGLRSGEACAHALETALRHALHARAPLSAARRHLLG